MSKKTSIENIDFNEMKNQIEQIKAASAKAKEEYEEKKARGEIKKQPLGQKIGGILILVLLLVGVGAALVSNLDTMLMPKNSVTIVVTDGNGEYVEGITIDLMSTTGIYHHDHENVDNLTLLDMEAGDYILTFEKVPEGYEAERLVDHFTLNQDGKVKLEYKVVKE